jgi:hypothetical protein
MVQDDQVIELRGSAAFDSKLDVLVKFTASVVENRGKATLNLKLPFLTLVILR